MAGRGDRAGGVEQDRVALPPSRAGEDLADRRRVLLGRAAGEVGGGAARDPELERVDLALACTSPSTTSQTRFGPAGESSSIPKAPWTTKARRAPSCASTSAIVGTSSGE